MSRPPARKPPAFRFPSLYPAVRCFVPLRFCRRILICPPGGTHGGKNPPHGAACETGPAPKGRAGFAPKRLRPVHHDAASAANLVLVEARRGGKPGLIWEKDLSLYTAQGQESPELRNIYHRA